MNDNAKDDTLIYTIAPGSANLRQDESRFRNFLSNATSTI